MEFPVSMITLNLIPARDKQELRLLNLFLALKNIVALTLVGVIAIAIGLIAAKLFLQNYFTYLVNSNVLNIGIGRFSSREIRGFKQTLGRVQQIQTGYVPWSELLLNLNRHVGPGVTLTDLTLQNDGSATLVGVAQTRENLLQLQTALIAAGLTPPFELPFAVKLQRENVRFDLRLKLPLPRLNVP